MEPAPWSIVVPVLIIAGYFAFVLLRLLITDSFTK